MTKNICIRKMKLADVVAAVRIHRNTIRKVNAKDYSPDLIEAWSGNLTNSHVINSLKDKKRFVATIKGKVVGFVAMDEHSKRLLSLYVSKTYIGSGVGSALLRKAGQTAKRNGAKRMNITSTLTAKGFYEKMGYKASRKNKKPLFGRQIAVWVMIKQL